MSLTQKEDEYWRALGYHAEKVECQQGGRGRSPSKRDLFGFIDRVYVGSAGQMVYVQVTSKGNMLARLKKIREGTTGKGQWALPMRTIVGRLRLSGALILIAGWELDDRHRYARTEWSLTNLLDEPTHGGS